jgi:site-specific DNA-methyltransferase (adenine-specific)
MTVRNWEGPDWRIECGDCLDLLKSLPSGSVDAVVTDPPYGINTKSDGGGKLNPWGDLCNSAFWYAAWLGEVRRVLRFKGAAWVCLNWRSLVTFQKASCDLGWPIESLMIWDKKWIGPGGSRGLRPSYEMVALFCGPEFSVEDRGIPDIQAFPWSSHKPTGHPAEKPVDLMRFCIDATVGTGATVLDPFMGSGTTGVACIQTGRKFIGFELDAKYCEIAARRIGEVGELFRQPKGEAQ